ncbi:MAG: hypothetical protein H6912_06290 [Kordiimonadaceae bacterium]|nr:hypothetical protein [Kordiimonadaceae bacterium]
MTLSQRGNIIFIVKIAIIWIIYSVFFVSIVTGGYRILKWRVEQRQRLEEILSNFEMLITTSVFTGVFFILLILTREYIPYGWVIFLINIIAIAIYASWKPYNWHMNNENSIRILKEHGITEPNWWNIRKLFSDQIRFLVNEQSIAKFYFRDVVIVYWPSVREIYWYELEIDKKMVEYLDIVASEDDFLGIDSNQKNFKKAVEIMKLKFPEFASYWEKRRGLPEDEEVGTILYKKYLNK